MNALENCRFMARSTSFASDATGGRISLMAEDGRHVVVRLTDSQIVLLSRSMSEYVYDQCIYAKRRLAKV